MTHPKWTVLIGTSRIVILIPFMGIAVKLPIIRVNMLLEAIWADVSRYKFKRSWKTITGELEYPFSLRWCLFTGIVANIEEFRFWKRTRHDFVWATQSSFFGLANIQRLGKRCGYTSKEVWIALHKIAGDDLFEDNHCFAESTNFCIGKDGKLKLLDYGSLGSQKVVLQYGSEFAKLSGSP